MHIRFGYEIAYVCPQPTPMILMLHVHPSRIQDLLSPDDMRVYPDVPLTVYHDGFGNTCTRLEAPAGRLTVQTEGLIQDPGVPEALVPDACEIPVSLLPQEILVYLLGSRYCDTEPFMHDAWRLFGHIEPGWTRVQAICTWVHEHILARRLGISRDYAHLAITLCRCLNIPARYCTGYLGNIGMQPSAAPLDFAAWFETFLGGHWHTFDPHHNRRRIGRILVARGRDAGDVAISTTFGANSLDVFRVWTDQVPDMSGSPAADAGRYPCSTRQ